MAELNIKIQTTPTEIIAATSRTARLRNSRMDIIQADDEAEYICPIHGVQFQALVFRGGPDKEDEGKTLAFCVWCLRDLLAQKIAPMMTIEEAKRKANANVDITPKQQSSYTKFLESWSEFIKNWRKFVGAQ